MSWNNRFNDVMTDRFNDVMTDRYNDVITGRFNDVMTDRYNDVTTCKPRLTVYVVYATYSWLQRVCTALSCSATALNMNMVATRTKSAFTWTPALCRTIRYINPIRQNINATSRTAMQYFLTYPPFHPFVLYHHGYVHDDNHGPWAGLGERRTPYFLSLRHFSVEKIPQVSIISEMK